MRAITVIPGNADSRRLDDVAEPPVEDDSVLVETLAYGVRDTDTDRLAGRIDAGSLNRVMMLASEVVFGLGNANRRHDDEGARALSDAVPVSHRSFGMDPLPSNNKLPDGPGS